MKRPNRSTMVEGLAVGVVLGILTVITVRVMAEDKIPVHQGIGDAESLRLAEATRA